MIKSGTYASILKCILFLKHGIILGFNTGFPVLIIILVEPKIIPIIPIGMIASATAIFIILFFRFLLKLYILNKEYIGSLLALMYCQIPTIIYIFSNTYWNLLCTLFIFLGITVFLTILITTIRYIILIFYNEKKNWLTLFEDSIILYNRKKIEILICYILGYTINILFIVFNNNEIIQPDYNILFAFNVLGICLAINIFHSFYNKKHFFTFENIGFLLISLMLMTIFRTIAFYFLPLVFFAFNYFFLSSCYAEFETPDREYAPEVQQAINEINRKYRVTQLVYGPDVPLYQSLINHMPFPYQDWEGLNLGVVCSGHKGNTHWLKAEPLPVISLNKSFTQYHEELKASPKPSPTHYDTRQMILKYIVGQQAQKKGYSLMQDFSMYALFILDGESDTKSINELQAHKKKGLSKVLVSLEQERLGDTCTVGQAKSIFAHLRNSIREREASYVDSSQDNLNFLNGSCLKDQKQQTKVDMNVVHVEMSKSQNVTKLGRLQWNWRWNEFQAVKDRYRQ